MHPIDSNQFPSSQAIYWTICEIVKAKHTVANETFQMYVCYWADFSAPTNAGAASDCVGERDVHLSLSLFLSHVFDDNPLKSSL